MKPTAVFIATLPEQDLIARLGANRPLPPFAAVAEGSRAAKARVLEGQTDELASYHAVRLLLRQFYLNGHNLQDALVFTTLLSHHPHAVNMSQVRKDTGLARQTAHRALTSHPHLIARATDPAKIDGRIHDPVFYRLTPLGLETVLTYLKLILKPCRPS